jgi:hypothetical protein
MYIFWTICSIPLIYTSVFVWISCFILLLCLCSIIQSQILYFQNNLFLQDILTNSDDFYLHMCFMIEFSLSVKHVIGILVGIILKLYITFSNTVIFTLLILSFYEHERSFHLLLFSSISFLQCFIDFLAHVFHLH